MSSYSVDIKGETFLFCSYHRAEVRKDNDCFNTGFQNTMFFISLGKKYILVETILLSSCSYILSWSIFFVLVLVNNNLYVVYTFP